MGIAFYLQTALGRTDSLTILILQSMNTRYLSIYVCLQVSFINMSQYSVYKSYQSLGYFFFLNILLSTLHSFNYFSFTEVLI